MDISVLAVVFICCIVLVLFGYAILCRKWRSKVRGNIDDSPYWCNHCRNLRLSNYVHVEERDTDYGEGLVPICDICGEIVDTKNLASPHRVLNQILYDVSPEKERARLQQYLADGFYIAFLSFVAGTMEGKDRAKFEKVLHDGNKVENFLVDCGYMAKD